MAHLASLLYAPLVLLALRYLPVTTVAWGMIGVSLVWLYGVRKGETKSFVFPLFYGLAGVVALGLEEGSALMGVPLFVAMAFFLFFLSPQGGVWLGVMASRFSVLEEREMAYVQKSRYFWACVALLNVCIHAMMLFVASPTQWALYASVGWYGVFVLGGALQFLHRKYVFLKGAMS
ncbi:MAG: hypothetical protein IBX45_02565 [Campylobacterales bacterium]|nr:hypothetical protein [Campylobacterales bacterium]